MRDVPWLHRTGISPERGWWAYELKKLHPKLHRATNLIPSVQGVSSMASNLEIAKRGYELFQRGDIATLVNDLIDDSCTWISPGPKDKLPWAGQFKGKQQIAGFFAQIAENIDFNEFAPR